MHLSRAFKVLLIALVVFAFASVATAFAAANTVPAHVAGEGDNAVTGYTVTNLAYTLNYADPSTIETLTFTIAPATADEIQVSFDEGATWFPCVVGAPVSCDISGAANVVAVEHLTVTGWYTP
jgi:hypothetical protein